MLYQVGAFTGTDRDFVVLFHRFIIIDQFEAMVYAVALQFTLFIDFCTQ